MPDFLKENALKGIFNLLTGFYLESVIRCNILEKCAILETKKLITSHQLVSQKVHS